MSDAKIVIDVDGADRVKKAFDELVSNAKKVGGAVEDASKKTQELGKSATKAGEFWKDFGKSVSSSLGTVATSALATVTAVQTISFAQAIQSAKALDDQFARFAAGSGRGIGGVRDQIRGISRETNSTEAAVLSWSKGLGRVTYDSNAALKAYKAFSDEAIASNQDISEQGGLAEVFSNSLGVSGDQSQKFLDSLRGMSDAAGNAGGFNAFKDQVQALGGAMSTLSLKTDDSKREFLAFQATIGKGQSPQQAARIQQGLIGAIQGNSEGLARQFGANNVYDENGRVKDIPTIVHKIRQDLEKRYGGSARKVAMQGNNFGSEVGASIFNFDEEAYRKTVNAGSLTDNAAAGYQGSDQGKIKTDDLKRDQNMEDAARKVMPANSAIGHFVAENPITSAVLGFGASILGKAGIGAGLKAGAGYFGLGGGGATAAVGGAGLLTSGAAALLSGGAGYLLGTGIDQATGASDAIGGLGNYDERQADAAFDKKHASKPVDPFFAAMAESFPGQSHSGNAQQVADQTAAIQDLPNLIAKAVADALKGSPINVNVLNQSGSPILGVNEVQEGNSEQ